jgi:NhaA family Na+:H+ antiporter
MSLPPEAWGPARSLALRIVRPVERFLHIQAASGVVLLVTAVVALA